MGVVPPTRAKGWRDRTQPPTGIGRAHLQLLSLAAKPVVANPAGWSTHYKFLGRWQGESTAACAVIRLTMPLDRSDGLEVMSDGANGRMIGQYGVFTPLPPAKP